MFVLGHNLTLGSFQLWLVRVVSLCSEIFIITQDVKFKKDFRQLWS